MHDGNCLNAAAFEQGEAPRQVEKLFLSLVVDVELEEVVRQLPVADGVHRVEPFAAHALDGEVMTPADWLDASGMGLRLTFAGGKILSLRFDRQDAKVSIDFEREEEIR